MSHIIRKDDLFKKILFEPANEYDELCVISGFATPSMAVYHMLEVKVQLSKQLKVNLIVGMTPSSSGISKPHHKNFVKLDKESPSFTCSYLNAGTDPTHSKLYTWLKDGKPQLAFLASANYTLNAFRRPQDEIATTCNPDEAYSYFKFKTSLSLYCTCSDAENLVRDDFVSSGIRSNSDEEQHAPEDISNAGSNCVKLPLFSEKQERIHKRGGLNWGQRDGREPNQAYIPVPVEISKSGFFPPRGQPFSVLTSDGFPFVCVIAQDGDKAIQTTNNNSELGVYFRRILGVPLGNPITLDDLDRFGNRYVKFTKINEEEYYMEFKKINSPSRVLR